MQTHNNRRTHEGLPVLLISACLAGEAVRYDGSDLKLDDSWLETLRGRCRLVAVCPEVMGGLPIPRVPSEIVGSGGDAVLDETARVVDRTGVDVTAVYVSGARKALQLALAQQAVAAVLTERSPSCGSRLIYSGDFDGRRRPGHGVTAALLRRQGLPVFSQHQLDDVLALV
jgi:uncharacterized protein YbbK (DUF523 family)